MRILTNSDEASGFRHIAENMPAGFQCCDCGAVRMFKLGSVGTGYAVVPGKQLCCYECCDARQRADLLDRSKPFCAYMVGNGTQVTSWSGGHLGAIHAHTQSRAGWHGGYIHRFHVRDVHGQWWQARGAGDGMICTMRPMKQPAYAKNWSN